MWGEENDISTFISFVFLLDAYNLSATVIKTWETNVAENLGAERKGSFKEAQKALKWNRNVNIEKIMRESEVDLGPVRGMKRTSEFLKL